MGQYSEPYRSATDPNKDPTTIAGEASIAYDRLRRGERAEDIWTDMGLSRTTFYRRVNQHAEMHDQPTRRLRQLLAEDDLDDLAGKARGVLGKTECADTMIRAITELRKINESKRNLFAVDEVPLPEPPAPPAPSAEEQEWVAAARRDSDAAIDEVRNGQA